MFVCMLFSITFVYINHYITTDFENVHELVYRLSSCSLRVPIMLCV